MHKITHNTVMRGEYKECSCNITAWSRGRWNSTAVLFPGEISLRRVSGRRFGFVSNVPGKELLWKSIARCCVLVQEMNTELVVTPGALSKHLAWRDAAQSSCDAHMVLTTSVFSSFPPLEHVAGSASLPVLKKYSSTRSQKQRTISLRQPALTVKSH